MGKLIKKGDLYASFYCPGCKIRHTIKIKGPHAWGFNGDFERPTITPSIKVSTPNETICHSYITDGKIRFLNDCKHELAGQTHDLT